eukprot:scaffold14781_cov48-Prasinocladus_malaysianus.AAC.3
MAASGGLEALSDAEGSDQAHDCSRGGSEIEDEDVQEAHYEEAYYGQHDRYLWADPEGGLLLDDHSRDSDHDCSRTVDEEDELHHDFDDLHITKASCSVPPESIRKPMEVKNVWVKPKGSQKPHTRPRTPKIASQDRENYCSDSNLHSLKNKASNAKIVKAPHPKLASKPRERPATARPAPREWDSSPVVQHPPHSRKSSAGCTPHRRPKTAASKPSSNHSFIVNNKAVNIARQGTKKVDRVARNQ